MNPFECNIPLQKPGFAYPAFAAAYKTFAMRVKTRMAKLEKVVTLLNEDPAKVTYAVRKYFIDLDGKTLLKDEAGNLLLDTMPAEIIADVLYTGMPLVRWNKFIEFPNAEILVNPWFITTSEWATFVRAIGLGGSDPAPIMLRGKYESQSLRTLFYTKTGKEKAPTAADDSGRAFIFEYGHIHEPQVIAEFCRRTGAKVLECPFVFRSKKHPWMIADIDAVVQMVDRSLYVFEAKTTGSQNWDDWRTGTPEQYTYQPPHYMAVLDDERVKGAFIGCIISNQANDFFCHRMDRDMATETNLIEMEGDFWNDYIVPGKIPPHDGDPKKNAYTFASYERKNLPDADPQILSGDKVQTIISRYRKQAERAEAAKEEYDSSKAELEATATELFSLLTTSSKGIVKDEQEEGKMFVVESRRSTRVTVNREKLAANWPDVYQQVAEESVSYATPKISAKKIPKKNPFEGVAK